MLEKPKLHFGLMCNRSNGGYDSALTLIDALQNAFTIQAWSLAGPLYPGHKEHFQQRLLKLDHANPTMKIAQGDAVLFYMNEYPSLWANYSQLWLDCLRQAGSVQIAFNRSLGTLPMEAGLAPYLRHIYFQDSSMQATWEYLVADNPLRSVVSSVLPPPVALDRFLSLRRDTSDPLIIGRLAGDAELPTNAIAFYGQLAEALPEAEFWFMPSSADLQNAYQSHPQFRFYQANEIPVSQFLQATQLYLLTYGKGIPIPGPRSLVEAMAAGCVPIVVNREGPKERVEHGVSGYCFDTDQRCVDFVLELAADATKRKDMASAARRRAKSFKISHWVTQIIQHSQPVTR